MRRLAHLFIFVFTLIALSLPAMSGPATRVSEVESKRSEYSKHFQNSDGSFTAETYSLPIHYKDRDGRWKDIDTRIDKPSKKGFAHSVEKNRVKVHLAGKAHGKHLLEADGMNIGFAPDTLSDSNGEVNGSSVTYRDAWTAADLNYTVVPDGIKEEIVLRSNVTNPEYSFTLTSSSLTLRKEADGSISFNDAAGNCRATIPSAFMRDATGRISYAVDLSLDAKPNKTVVRIKPDVNWLKDAAYPVVIDPTITFGYTPVAKCNRDQVAYTPSEAAMYIGNVNDSSSPLGNGFHTAFLKFSVSPTPGTVNSVWLNLTAASNASNQSVSVRCPQSPCWIDWSGVYPPLGSVLETRTWISGAPSLAFTSDALKAVVQGWMNGTINNYGFEFETGSADPYMKFHGIQASDANTRPKLEVNYTAPPTPPATPVLDEIGRCHDNINYIKTNNLSASWVQPSGPPAAAFWYSVGQYAEAADLIPWTSNGLDTSIDLNIRTVPPPGNNYPGGTPFFLSIRAIDSNGVSSETVTSNPIIIDYWRPTVSGVSVSPSNVQVGSPITVSYANVTDNTGVDKVRLKYRKSADIEWSIFSIENGGDSSGSFVFTPDTDGMYFFVVEAEDYAGHLSYYSAEGYGWSVVTSATGTYSPGFVKVFPNGDEVSVNGVVTAVYDGYFYIEDEGRCSGIRVDKTGHGLSIGAVVEVKGTLGTKSASDPATEERYVDANLLGSSVTVTSPDEVTILPLGLTNRVLGGGNWYCGPNGAGQKGTVGDHGVDGKYGWNNIGSLVRVWGEVKSIQGQYLFLDDGSALDQSDVIQDEWVRVLNPNDPSKPIAVGDFVCVTGISSCYSGTDSVNNPIRKKQVLLRGLSEDVSVYPQATGGTWVQTGWTPGITYIISAPLVPFKSDPAVVFKDVSGNPLLIDGNLTRLDAMWTGYTSYMQEELFGEYGGILPGEAHWYSQYEEVPTSWKYEGVPDGVPDENGIMTDMVVSMPIENGWVLLGTPYNHKVLLSDCQVTNGFDTLSFRDAVAAGWVDSTVYGFQGPIGSTSNTWDPAVVLEEVGVAPTDANKLKPFEGYGLSYFLPNLAMILPGEMVSKPEFTPDSGIYYSPQTITITCETDGATIYYTINGDTPTTESSVYSGPISVTSDMTVKAVAVKAGVSDSPVEIATYTIDNSTPPDLGISKENRGLSNADMSHINSNDANRCNIRWANPEANIGYCDSFKITDSSKSEWIVDTIRVWVVPDLPMTPTYHLGDHFQSVSLYTSNDELKPLVARSSGSFTAGSDITDNRCIIVTPVGYSTAKTGYQAADGSLCQIWQVDFKNLNWKVTTGKDYIFGVHGVSKVDRLWFLHAMNSSLAGFTSGDGKFWQFDAGNLSGARTECTGANWFAGKGSDLNIQVFAH